MWWCECYKCWLEGTLGMLDNMSMVVNDLSIIIMSEARPDLWLWPGR